MYNKVLFYSLMVVVAGLCILLFTLGENKTAILVLVLNIPYISGFIVYSIEKRKKLERILKK